MTSVTDRSVAAVKLAWFLSFFFLALVLGGSLAHLYELPHKLSLSAAEYLTVQQIYRGWALLGLPIIGALTSMATLTVMLRRQGSSYAYVVAALLCVLATQVIFWLLTFPVNQATSNWTVLPADWAVLRARWEWSHAAGAAINLAAFAALVLSLLAGCRVDVRP